MARHVVRVSLLLALSIAMLSLAPHGAGMAAARTLVAGSPAGPQQPGLYLYDLGTGSVRQILPLTESDGMPQYAWSPDGSRLAVALNEPDTRSPLQVIDVASGSAASVLPSGSGYASQLRWSPGGDRLAFVFASTSDPNVSSALRVWSAADGSLQTLVPNLASFPAWTPDGSGITVSLLDPTFDLTSANNRIVTVDATSGAITQTILSGSGAACQLGLAWSPDGAYLAYGGHGFHEGCLPDTGGVYTWNAATGATTQLTAQTAEAPVWSADGTVLAAVASGADQSGPSRIAIQKFQPDGSGTQTLVDGLANDFPPPRPRFQSANSELIYSTLSCSGADVWALDPGSTQLRKLNAGMKYAIGAHLSPDGQTAAWTGAGPDAGTLVLAPVDGGPAMTAFSGALSVVPGDFSPDGRWLLFGTISYPNDPCAGP